MLRRTEIEQAAQRARRLLRLARLLIADEGVDAEVPLLLGAAADHGTTAGRRRDDNAVEARPRRGTAVDLPDRWRGDRYRLVQRRRRRLLLLLVMLMLLMLLLEEAP